MWKTLPERLCWRRWRRGHRRANRYHSPYSRYPIAYLVLPIMGHLPYQCPAKLTFALYLETYVVVYRHCLIRPFVATASLLARRACTTLPALR